MASASVKTVETYGPAILEWLTENPGCYPSWQIQRAVYPEKTPLFVEGVLYVLVKERQVDRRSLGGSRSGYCLPDYAGEIPRRDAVVLAQEKLIKTLPSQQEPLVLGQLQSLVGFSHKPVREALRGLIESGLVESFTQEGCKYYRWRQADATR